MRHLNEKETEALAALRRCAEVRHNAVVALIRARAACDVAGFGSEIRAGLVEVDAGLDRAKHALNQVIKLIEA